MKIEATNTSMMIDYFVEQGLEKRTGLRPFKWDLMIIKELVDNALDAVEALEEKKITVSYDTADKRLEILDNGNGITEKAILESIYDFTVYHSNKRNYITPSRGKQGNGLKTVISACYLKGYKIIWYTAEGKALSCIMEAERVEYGENPKLTVEYLGYTDKRGICITGLVGFREWIIKEYAECNPDVNIIYNLNDDTSIFQASRTACNKSNDTDISFYTVESLQALIEHQDAKTRYKTFLRDAFGTRISNASRIKGKIEDIDFQGEEFKEDFSHLQTLQTKKRFTILKNHMIGLSNSIELEDETGKPYIVEFDILETGKKGSGVCTVYANNSITYKDGQSVEVSVGHYQIGTRKNDDHYCSDLVDIVYPYNDYNFKFHFICPDLVYTDVGKTAFDITGIIKPLTVAITKKLKKVHAEYTAKTEKRPDDRSLMRKHLTAAFNIASNNGRYIVTARQIFYKLRELSGGFRGKDPYYDFRQNMLTEWFENNPDLEERVYFSERGKFYCDGISKGIGTGTVKDFISRDVASNSIEMVVNSSYGISSDFNRKFRYDKVLYIEKTGFDFILQSEHISEKYNMIIVSGQGFATRAVKKLLYDLYKKGMTIFCLHDLDYSGINIYNSIRFANDLFEHDIPVIDLGITLQDVYKYGIEPEIYERSDDIIEEKYTPEQQAFFFPDSEHLRRVEINAFTTEQILEILDDKLSAWDTLPKVNLADVLDVNLEDIKKTALINVAKKKFSSLLNDVEIDYLVPHERMTAKEAEQASKVIIDDMIQRYERVIDENLTKLF